MPDKPLLAILAAEYLTAHTESERKFYSLDHDWVRAAEKTIGLRRALSADWPALAQLIVDQTAEITRLQAQVEELLDERDNLQTLTQRRIGLSRELEVELFGAVQPIQADGGESVNERALSIIRALKARAQQEGED